MLKSTELDLLPVWKEVRISVTPENMGETFAFSECRLVNLARFLVVQSLFLQNDFGPPLFVLHSTHVNRAKAVWTLECFSLWQQTPIQVKMT